MDEAADRSRVGVLGPALSRAIAEYNQALERLGVAEAELAEAQRGLSEARARLTALAAGARATSSRALLVVESPAPTPPPMDG